MHRVELKVKQRISSSFFCQVPNAPCGVERYLQCYHFWVCFLFLMHRVELKDSSQICRIILFPRFLMHRVELKVGFQCYSDCCLDVPNAPCGVERYQQLALDWLITSVPNAPCGVESGLICTEMWQSKAFLMHRVELKVLILPGLFLLGLCS